MSDIGGGENFPIYANLSISLSPSWLSTYAKWPAHSSFSVQDILMLALILILAWWNTMVRLVWVIMFVLKDFFGVLNCWSMLNFVVNKNSSSKISMQVSYSMFTTLQKHMEKKCKCHTIQSLWSTLKG